jgi:hypothetical protein
MQGRARQGRARQGMKAVVTVKQASLLVFIHPSTGKTNRKAEDCFLGAGPRINKKLTSWRSDKLKGADH